MARRCTQRWNRSPRLQVPGFILATLGVAVAAHLPSVQAQTPKANSSSPIYKAPPPPTDQGAPVGRRQGGGSRGGCHDYGELTALMPIRNGSVIGTTRAAEPTFWFYVPSPLTSDTTFEFVLKDQEKNDVYRTELAFDTESAGILPISVRQPAAALEAGEVYSWSLALYCDPERPSASVHVKGLLQQLNGGILNQSDAAPDHSRMANPSLQQATADAQNGIWLESITHLALLRQTEPSNPDVVNVWSQLLQQEELDHLSTAVILTETGSTPMLEQP